ncbi:MAG: hypothetical protein CNF02_06235 [OM182 bacterium MED-G28]|uniref:DUF418 domain-containing protein n=1 Tax=OM182 bacterium MED-G28 TaxID=1986256 RepID=A0A2A5WC72_9GAMM|nr:MAG: hypothetical protein CNF02_06235 [OM182 bacterium MED-G28]
MIESKHPETAGASVNTGPVAEKERIRSIDTLRGLALLGILLLNIITFANPFAAYFDPRVDGADSGLNLAVAMAVDIWFEGSFRAIFSMLFGAGLLIFIDKPSVDANVTKSLYYRRTILLVGFGLFNSYFLLWAGDILYAYGMTGLLLYFFRDFPARKLAQFAALIFLLLSLLHTGQHINGRAIYAEYQTVASLPADSEISADQQQILDTWDLFQRQQFAAPDQITGEIEARQGSYISNFLVTAEINIVFQSVVFLINNLWDVGAMMLLGMAFMKWKILDASRSMSFYLKMTAIGFGVGLTINTWEVVTYVSSGFEPFWAATARPSYDVGRMAMAFGYIGLVMIICKLGILVWLRYALARVGQMALTNYLSQSLICNIIFMGFGFGLFAQLGRVEIYYVVFGVWVFQILFSIYWLKHYRFGPAEWLWRSLTYKKKQPLKIQ